MRVKPFSLLAALGTAAHHGFERAAGVGLVFEPLGVATAPALLASARHHFSWAREQAQREPERWSPALRS